MASIEPALIWIASICAAILGIGSFIKAVLAPYKKLLARMEQLEKSVNENYKEIIRETQSIHEQERVNRMTLQSCSLLMKHCADTNHTGELKALSKKVDDFIITKGGSL